MSVAKLKLVSQVTKTDKAWLINIEDQGEHWIPFVFIKEYKPWIHEIKIDTYILEQKGIKFKV